ncbi:hypothetical protein TRM7557_01934 [Tritonibacter multivorans]|uniref:SGNH hydrolase-type esterase domain-containing protein n=1 Tax=Tritonibacter multivorans TaxID=928856 RepID=A0A0P1GAY1_9RHOB|nr:SGNH/GDSL hydrolase family protein [Tritonibacter multivorans]MDA7422063.1 SGNH/GDSL hydrolase family protein [Tritonibacter multivorans]CUH78542.1 hypothetical protein TRM7557_01934 [Tritonibacter multivorans]SFD18257.1 Lysophospholipase L1 [Tritonibacter multivorans]
MSHKRIMCFGDSLTWGWIPVEEAVPTTRYAPDVRWTGVLQAQLGDDFVVIEEGQSARTTTIDDPADPRLNGSAYLPSALASHMPLDLVVIMLGTNDTKVHYKRTAFEIAMGMSKLIGQARGCAGGVGTTYPAPEVLVMAPPPLGTIRHPHFQAQFEGGYEKSAELGGLYGNLADFLKVHFMNAGDHISTDGIDGIHFDEANNRDLGVAVATKVRGILDRVSNAD